MKILKDKFNSLGKTHKIITIELITLAFIGLALLVVDHVRSSPTKKVAVQEVVLTDAEKIQKSKAVAAAAAEFRAKSQQQLKLAKNANAVKRSVASTATNSKYKKQQPIKPAKSTQKTQKTNNKRS